MENENILFDMADALESIGSDYTNSGIVDSLEFVEWMICNWPMDEIDKDIADQGLERELVPLLRDSNVSHTIILYPAMDKSFSAWASDWTRKLCKKEHYRTDIFEPIYILTEIWTSILYDSGSKLSVKDIKTGGVCNEQYC